MMKYAREVTLLIMFIIAMFIYAPTESWGAYNTLEITQPRSGLNTQNRYYKAYPGLEYNVRIAVIGGAYPYSFALTTAPVGMTITSNGTIVWPNPVASATPYAVTARVTDSEGTTASVTWNITVTTNGFRFIDAVNGRSVAEGGTGTLNNPWKTIKDWYEGDVYESKGSSTYVNEFLYYRAGTYEINGYFEGTGRGRRMPVLGTRKPVVWLAYPGERVVIDHRYSGDPNTGSYICFYSNSNNLYIDGIEFRNMYNHSIKLDCDGDNQVIRRSTFYNLGPGEDGANSSFIMTTGNGGIPDNMVIQDCTFSNLTIGAFNKFYVANKLLIEDNTFANGLGSPVEGIALKSGIFSTTVRNNRFYSINSQAIGGNMHPNPVLTTANIEICYNFVATSTSSAIRINQDGLAGVIYIYRNTFMGPVWVTANAGNGPFRFEYNVFVNDQSGTPAGSHIYYYNVTDPTRILSRNNLAGYPRDGIVNSQGALTASYQQYLGTHGYQLTGSPLPPSTLAPPTGVRILQ
jgi:hypothetical protein